MTETSSRYYNIVIEIFGETRTWTRVRSRPGGKIELPPVTRCTSFPRFMMRVKEENLKTELKESYSGFLTLLFTQRFNAIRERNS